jgi:3-hydroxyacyl-[acyl-carrier-protein] dehydratase
LNPAHVFTIDAAHPAFAGHFPGHPIAPGVLLLQHVAQALRASTGQRMSGVVEAKFLQPLLPGETASVTLAGGDGRWKFTVVRGDDVLARGSVTGSAT